MAPLDTMVTVVDAFNFVRDLGSQDSIRERGESFGAKDARTVVDLLIDQVEFCDVIVLNKIDLVSDEQRDRLLAMLQKLNPRARIELAEFGQVSLDRVLGTNLFDFEEAAKAPGWLQELRGTHVPETEEYGITSFVYRARRPFHARRFYALVQREWPGVVRSKGYFWLASDTRLVGSWSQAGAVARHQVAGMWWAAVPQEQWPRDPETIALIRSQWDSEVGDARQELVLIGVNMDEAAMRGELDACLLTDAEMKRGPRAWMRWDNPFPGWS